MVLDPALRMKAQKDSNSRGQKDFICREQNRKTVWQRMQGDLEPVVLWVRVGSGFYSFFLCALPEGRDAFQMQMGIS
jgi:hypothetical protein